MIASLNGKVLAKDENSLILGMGGVGVQVLVPAPLFDQTPIGEAVFLQTTLVVREDSLTLYGFKSLEEKKFFELLMGVNGIGPRLALTCLSTLNPEAMRRAVFHEQPEVFNRVSGIGKKTAQKILLHLQGRVGQVDELAPTTAITEIDTEVLEALTSLGYSVVEAQAAIQSLPTDAPEDVESRLMQALQYFS